MNLNDTVWVKWTQKGIDARIENMIARHGAEFVARFPEYNPPQVGVWWRTQLWVLMQNIGPSISMTSPAFCEKNEIALTDPSVPS